MKAYSYAALNTKGWEGLSQEKSAVTATAAEQRNRELPMETSSTEDPSRNESAVVTSLDDRRFLVSGEVKIPHQ